MKVGIEVAAGAFEMGTSRMAFGYFGYARAAVMRRAENDGCGGVSALVARMAQHRQPHRSGEDQQGQKATE